ncbi:methylated-DNA--[protein]-cysteine S-methyltransferase [Hydrogenivirga caldilitoris]|uniref:methylated-DNA--[protein]-cysteine S-methyltransferase n=1 Tax=Hydrogenivirga caldilitoris TaxID=246264 RepID=UPI001B8776BF|nr:methylated-DNA--[protein]-cysteine S-methyltransferase [Hydrogenivirga caldilitoris]
MKITRNLYLEVHLEGPLVRGCTFNSGRVAPSKGNTILSKIFDKYISKRGDAEIEFDRLDLTGYTEEVVEVYRVLRREVPFGRTITYGELGKLTGKHPRFVAYCMKINRFPIIVPCHRVVSKFGLGGFSYGIELKALLLKFERGEA